MRTIVTASSLVWAIVLSVASLWMPPAGVIDSSVLILLAQILVFIASIFGIKLPSSITKLVEEYEARSKKKMAS